MWSKTLMELIFNPRGEFRWSLEGPTLLTSTLVPRDLFRSFKIYWDAKERMRCGKQRKTTASIESLVKLQPWFLSLLWKTCLRQTATLVPAFSVDDPAFGHNCHLGSWVCSRRPVFGQNCNLGSCVCRSDQSDDDIILSYPKELHVQMRNTICRPNSLNQRWPALDTRATSGTRMLSKWHTQNRYI